MDFSFLDRFFREKIDSSSEKIFWKFLRGFTFLSAFVFIEPSPAEFWFILFLLVFIWKSKLSKELMVYFLLLLLPAIISTYIGLLVFHIYNLRFLIIDLYLFVLFFLVASSLKNFSERISIVREIQKVFLFWIFGGLANVVISFVSLKTSGILYGIELFMYGIRMKGFFKDPNVLAPYLVPPAIFLLDQIFTLRRLDKRSVLVFFTFLMISVGVLFTFSRAGWLNYLISLFVFFLIKLREKELIRTLSVLIASLLIIFVSSSLLRDVNIFGYNVTDFLTNRAQLQHYDQGRFAAQAKFAEILDSTSPFTGCGPGNYEVFAGMATHSLYARYFSERGILGFMLFVIFLGIVIRKATLSSVSEILVPSLIGQLVNSIFIDSLHWRHLWILFALSFL